MNTEILHGDALGMLELFEDDSIDCVVTSPPYWGLRDYGVDGQLGLEKTPDEYVENMIAVFREVRRVLRHQGTLWLNIGDSYFTKPAGNKVSSGFQQKAETRSRSLAQYGGKLSTRKIPGLKPKDLVGIPWRLAFALQADGWFLCQDVIWHKPNPMPESVTDRCTKAHEYIFLFSKSKKYFFDSKAIQEPLAESSASRYAYAFGGSKVEALIDANKTGVGRRTGVLGKRDVPTGRNRRSVWTVPTKSFRGAHFATFPPDLIEPCILAGCPEGGTVLDPFFGAGTTGLVAERLKRKCIGIELNSEYVEIAKRRLANAD